MKSFCIKTNNNDILNYLLSRIHEVDFEDLIYSKNKFKIYENVIIHYQGEDNDKFLEFLVELITEVIIEFYEEKLIKQILNYNYFYFDEYERIKICNNCMEIIDSGFKPENNFYNIDNLEGKRLEEKTRIDMVKCAVKFYLRENKSMILEGFVHFRLKEYLSYLDNVIDTAVNQFIIEKEYNEFINILRIYVESKIPNCNLIHLIYINGESIILDEEKNIVSVSENVINAKYLSDISFSSNDLALNILLTLLPEKVEIHLIGDEDDFINTIKLIFDGRVFICKECNICRTYRMLNNAKIEWIIISTWILNKYVV